MTRINLPDPIYLTDKHLFSEWRELPRVFRLQIDARSLPPAYTLGKGHERFFLAHMGWLGRRHAALTAECLRRGYNLTPRDPLPTDGGDWEPTPADVAVNVWRLMDRLRTSKRPQHFWGKVVPVTFYDWMAT